MMSRRASRDGRSVAIRVASFTAEDMTRLFIRFYLGVLLVLFASWYIHGRVSDNRSLADRARVVTGAHGGGARLVADELNTASSPEQQQSILAELRQRFDYRLQIVPIKDLPQPARQKILEGSDIAYDRDTVVAALANEKEVVRLGSFPNYTRHEIEASLAGWMRLTKDRLDAIDRSEWPNELENLQTRFEIPVMLTRLEEMPEAPRNRVAAYAGNVAFYSPDEKQWYSAIQLSEHPMAVRFGPFPSFEDIEQKAAATTLALVLLPAAVAIALLLRPVARQLRQLENAAQTIAGGDLGARVDERRMRSAKPLANAFNHMAARTESLVRTQRELLQAVSHELRTPLSRMRFAIDLIATAKTQEERQLRLDSLDAATEELDGLVGELLSYVRMETAELPLEMETLSVRQSIDSIVEKFASLYPSVDFHGAEELGEFVWADRAGFQRAMANLVSNAGRYANAQVVVGASSDEQSTVIDVDDDGPGIPEADRSRVFEPFVRLEAASGTTDARGVGLGLALVHRIVQRNGGSIEVLDSPLGGCRIRTRWQLRCETDSRVRG